MTDNSVKGPFLSLSSNTRYGDKFGTIVKTNSNSLIEFISIDKFQLTVIYDDKKRIQAFQNNATADDDIDYIYEDGEMLPSSAITSMYQMSKIAYDEQGLIRHLTFTYKTNRVVHDVPATVKHMEVTVTENTSPVQYDLNVSDIRMPLEIWNGGELYAFTYPNGVMNITNYTNMRELSDKFISKSYDDCKNDTPSVNTNTRNVFIGFVILLLAILIMVYLYRRNRTTSTVNNAPRLYQHHDPSYYVNPRSSGASHF